MRIQAWQAKGLRNGVAGWHIAGGNRSVLYWAGFYSGFSGLQVNMSLLEHTMESSAVFCNELNKTRVVRV
jgi:hypothetical protein